MAKRDGFKVGIGKLANGTPHFDLWCEWYAPWLVEAAEKYGAPYLRHVYGGDLVAADGTISKALPHYPYRVVDELEYLRGLGWRGGLAITECGLDGGYGRADWSRFHFQVTKFEQALRPYADNVIGFCWWECGQTNWDANYTEYLKQMEGYMIQNSLPKWEMKTAVEPPPVTGTTAQKIFTMSQSWAFPVNEDAALQKIALTDGYTPSGQELWYLVDGVKYAMQPFYKVGSTNDKRSYYATVGDWGNVKWTDGTDSTYIIPIAHLSQNGSTANQRTNDCGAAAVAMVVRGLTDKNPTVDDVAIKYQSPANTYMNFTQVDAALNGYGVDGTDKRPFYTQGIEAAIRDGLPVIALVKYPSLPVKFSTFQGCHFIVIYGLGIGVFLYRDPLQPEGDSLEASLSLGITPEELTRAMYDVQIDGNLPAHGMTCAVKAPPVEPPPVGQTYNTSSFLVPDPRSFVVVDRGAAGGENISHVFTADRMVRVKNGQQAEWYSKDGLIRYRDTSPADDNSDTSKPPVPCLYVQYTHGTPGGWIAPEVCEVGKTYTFFSDVQFKRKSDCKNLAYRSGYTVPSTFKLVEVKKNYTFSNGVTVDELYVTIQTGELQLYCKKDGVMRGWCGGGAEQPGNKWTAMPIEFYLDRKLQALPPEYCS